MGWAPVVRADASLRVFAASSLSGLLEAAWAGTIDDAQIAYEGSGTIARQIAQGAPADLVILADPDWMTWLGGQGIAFAAPPQAILGNTLVLIAPRPLPGTPPPTVWEQLSAAALSAALGDGRLAMGEHRAVPAGRYGKAWLDKMGAWATLSGRLAETSNVRAALALVALGESPLGLVYHSDALAEPKVVIRYFVPPDQHPDIIYQAVALTPAGTRALALLTAPAGQRHFVNRGFALPKDAP